MLERNKIYQLDALKGLQQLPDESVDMVITSPPYWGLRDYGSEVESIWDGDEKCKHEWVGKTGSKLRGKFCKHCSAWKGQLGLEPNFTLYLKHLLQIFDKVYRVLKQDGTLWVNLGDSYAGSWGNYGRDGIQWIGKNENFKSRSWLRRGPTLRPPTSLKQELQKKSLCMVPERFAIEMIGRRWILRNKIIWHKPNPMPSPVKDRLTNSWEYVFFFSKSKKYYFDLDAIREPHKTAGIRRTQHNWDGQRESNSSWQGPQSHRMCHPKGRNPSDFIENTGIINSATLGLYNNRENQSKGHLLGKNPGDCWDISTRGFKEAHFATFPERLLERPIMTTPLWICKRCGTPKTRITKTHRTKLIPNITADRAELKKTGYKIAQPLKRCLTMHSTQGWTSCACKAGWRPSLILDIFMGSGTTAAVAKRLSRDYIGFEMNSDYVKMAEERLKSAQGSK